MMLSVDDCAAVILKRVRLIVNHSRQVSYFSSNFRTFFWRDYDNGADMSQVTLAQPMPRMIPINNLFVFDDT